MSINALVNIAKIGIVLLSIIVLLQIAVPQIIMPRLRLLPALPSGDPHQRLCPHGPDAAPCAFRRVADAGMAGKDEEDRGLPALREMHEQMPLRAEHAGAPEEELRGLQDVPGVNRFLYKTDTNAILLVSV